MGLVWDYVLILAVHILDPLKSLLAIRVNRNPKPLQLLGSGFQIMP